MKFLTVLIVAVCLFSGCDSQKGPTGDTGPRGGQGKKGDQGIQGEKGEKGDQGNQGEQGEKGEAVYTEVAIDEEKGLLLISDASWSWDSESYYPTLVISGLAKNTGTTTLGSVRIYSKAYDSEGRLISSARDFIDYYSLKPGHETWFKFKDYDCDQEPSKVTLGYSFDLTVMVAAPKRIYRLMWRGIFELRPESR